MNESQYTQSINKLLPKSIYRWKISDRYTSGIPDCWYCGPDSDIWIEYKYTEKPTKLMLPPLTALQNRWLLDRHIQNQNVAVIYGTPLGSLIYTNGGWLTPLPKEVFFSRSKTKKEIAEWITNQCMKEN